MKLKRSVTMILLLFSLVPLGIYGVFSIYEMNHKIETMTRYNLQAISENQIANIQKFADDRRASMERIASYAMTMDAIKYSLGISEEDADKDYMENILKEQKEYSDYVASVSVIDKEFKVVSSSEIYTQGETSQLKNVDKKFCTGQFIIGNVYERETDEGVKKVVPAYIGVYEGKELMGYISEELDTAYFDDLRLNMDTLTNGTFYLLDGEYTIITAGNNTAQTSLTSFATKSNGPSDYQEKWSQIDFEKNPSGELLYKYNGEDYITYYSNVDNTDWSIRISENLTAQQREMKSDLVLLVLLLVILVVSILVIQTYMTNKILNPLEKALETFHSIEKNQDYSLRMPIKSKDEIGTLMEGINELLTYIEDERIHEKIIQRELKIKAENDSMTGVKNKKTIENYVMDMVNLSIETGSRITMGFLDIDDFRRFNTEYGHQKADEVICHVAKALQNNMYGEVGRIGGDEFLICYRGEISEEEIRKRAEKALKIIEEGVEDGERRISVTCSLGVVTATGKNLDYLQLVRLADEAMYEAKNSGKNAVVIKSI